MNDTYHENFTKKIIPESLDYVMREIRDVHTEEAGWVVGEPEIISKNPDGTITISVSLTKYPVEKKSGRSM